MQYEGPTTADIANTQALNRAYVAGAIRGVGAGAALRLVKLPFLMFSMREHDRRYWDALLIDDGQSDLLAVAARPERQQLQSAALAFLWQLSRQNSYAARLVSGAPPGWCERLAETTLVELLQRAAVRDDLIVPRFPVDSRLMQRLLRCDSDNAQQVQRMSQKLALQTLLTGAGGYRELRAAACNMRSRTRRVAERTSGREV